MSMRPFSETITTPAEADALIARYFETGDEAVFGPMIRAMTNEQDEGVFAIMRGSDNDMSPFDKALYLLREAGLQTRDQSIALIYRLHNGRKTVAAE
jgi:hypothetical protein